MASKQVQFRLKDPVYRRMEEAIECLNRAIPTGNPTWTISSYAQAAVHEKLDGGEKHGAEAGR